MGLELREALRRLCVEIGWSYAVFWRAVGFPSPKHLVWGDGHWHGKKHISGSDDVNSLINSLDEFQSLGEGSIDELVNKAMVSQVHAIGVGIVGQVASTGNHRWILNNVAAHNELTLKHFSDVNIQFLAGIQTIVIIPVFPHGVVQFGSTRRVMENLMFVNHARTSFMQLAKAIDSFGEITQKSIYPNKLLPHQSISNRLFRDSCSIVEGSLSTRCSHQLSVPSAARSFAHSQSYPSVCILPNTPNIDEEALLKKKTMGPTFPPSSTQFYLNKQMQNELVESHMISKESLPRSMVPSTSGTPSFREQSLQSLFDSRSQRSDGIFVNFNAELPKIEPMGRAMNIERLASACNSEILHPHGSARCSNLPDMILGGNSINENQSILLNTSLNSLPGTFTKPNGSVSSVSFSSSGLLPWVDLNECKILSSNKAIHCFENAKTEKLKADCGDNDLYAMLDQCKPIEHRLAAEFPSCKAQLNHSPIYYQMDDDISCAEVFSGSNTDQLLDAVVSNIYRNAIQSSEEALSRKASATKISTSSICCVSPSNDQSSSSGHKLGEYISTSVRTADSVDDKSQMSLWAESGKSLSGDKRANEVSKVSRKRARPGETPRPRPKDRQLIMDRVKELREIVPDGAKCSIDALLEKTIKHMLFLQSVTKHADKLKETGEPKIISKDGVASLKENLRGGATWAFEVGSQTMTCPIIVEDLNPPREMLVEMLCEERGLFLEIADLIRGLGLTILKGVMEARRDKIWARFAVEANRDVTRMEIFLSLVHLLEPTIGGGAVPHIPLNSSKMPQNLFNLHCVPATGVANPLQ